jgi:hypothetical protein
MYLREATTLVSAKERERQAASQRFETRIRTDQYLCVHRRWAVPMTMHYIVQGFYHRSGKKCHSTGKSRQRLKDLNSVPSPFLPKCEKGLKLRPFSKTND